MNKRENKTTFIHLFCSQVWDLSHNALHWIVFFCNFCHYKVIMQMFSDRHREKNNMTLKHANAFREQNLKYINQTISRIGSQNYTKCNFYRPIIQILPGRVYYYYFDQMFHFSGLPSRAVTKPLTNFLNHISATVSNSHAQTKCLWPTSCVNSNFWFHFMKVLLVTIIIIFLASTEYTWHTKQASYFIFGYSKGSGISK